MSAKRSYAIICGVLLLLAFGLRFHLLGAQSLWNDEGSSFVQAGRSFSEIAAHAARDIHPPGYYAALAVWRGLTGDSEFALRALSAFASLLTVALTVAIGKRVYGWAGGLLAGLIVALNTFQIYYAQEARMYALLALWSAAAAWALLGLMRDAKRRNRWALTLALCNAVGLYTQYAYPFVMLAQSVAWAVWWLSKYGRSLGRPYSGLGAVSTFILANLLTIALYLPWLPTALHQVTTWPNTGQAIPTGEALATIAQWLIFGIVPPSETVMQAVLLVANVLVIASGVGLWRKGGLLRAYLPLLWVLIPVGVFLILGMFRPANLKLLLPSQAMFAVWVGGLFASVAGGKNAASTTAQGGASPRPYRFLGRLGGLILLSLILLPQLPALYTDSRYQRSDYRGMVAQISAAPRRSDAVILDAPNQAEAFNYYYRAAAPVYSLPPGLGGDDAETERLVREVIAQHQRIFVLFWGEAERDPNHVVERILDSETFQAGEDRWFGDVRFAVYAAPAEFPAPTPHDARFGEHIRLTGYALNAESFQAGDVLQAELTWQTDALLSDAPAYKVFLQVLNSDGVLVAQRDAEPVSNSRPTATWAVDERILDRHGLALPADLSAGDYTLIVGWYERDNPSARLPVGDSTYWQLATIHVN